MIKNLYTDEMKISVSVKPNAKKDQIETKDAKEYIVHVKAVATDGKANAALIRLLADHFGVAQSRISIVSGFSSRKKIVEIA